MHMPHVDAPWELPSQSLPLPPNVTETPLTETVTLALHRQRSGQVFWTHP
jgi:hypothetical protein